RFVPAGPGLDELCEVVAALARPAPEDGDADGSGDVDDPLRLLGRITAGVAHDLGNYLSALAAVVALLDNARADPALVARARELMDPAGGIPGTLVGYAGGARRAFEPVDLGALVERMLALLARVIPPGIAVHADLAALVPSVRGATAELEQLV